VCGITFIPLAERLLRVAQNSFEKQLVGVYFSKEFRENLGKNSTFQKTGDKVERGSILVHALAVFERYSKLKSSKC
jgi:hypothetical protein